MAGKNNQEENSHVFSANDDDDESVEPRDTSERDTSGRETSSEMSSSPSPPGDDAAEAGPSCPDRSTGAIPKKGKHDSTSSEFPESSTQSDLGDSDSSGPKTQRSDTSSPDVYQGILELLAGPGLTQDDRKILLPLYFRMLETMNGTESVEEQRDALQALIHEQTLVDRRAAENKTTLLSSGDTGESSADDSDSGEEKTLGQEQTPPVSTSVDEDQRVSPGKELTTEKEGQLDASQSEPDAIAPVRNKTSCKRGVGDIAPDSECLPTVVKSGEIMGSSQLNPESQSCSSKGSEVASTDEVVEKLEEIVDGAVKGLVDRVATTDSGSEATAASAPQSETESIYPATLTSSGDAETLASLSPSSSDLESETGERVVAPGPTSAGKQEKRPAGWTSSDEEQRVSPRKKLTTENPAPSQSETGETPASEKPPGNAGN